jgi:hypothetical protein
VHSSNREDCKNHGGNHATDTSSKGCHCRVCGKNENARQILLCDLCDGEYHTYCLKPPLTQIPSGDWFCGKCLCSTPVIGFSSFFHKLLPKVNVSFRLFLIVYICLEKCVPKDKSDDHFEVKVAALLPNITNRYGEVVWALGVQEECRKL